MDYSGAPNLETEFKRQSINLELLEEIDYSTIIGFNKGKDADFLYQWAGPGYDFPISEKQIADRIANGVNGVDADTYIFKILSESSNEMIGTIELFRINNEKKTATIGRFLIDENLRSKGIGEIALKLLVNKGFEEFALNEIYLKEELVKTFCNLSNRIIH